MPKINALPAMSALDAADVIAADDVSTTNKDTKKVTMTQIMTWLQSLAAWITHSMVSAGFVVQEVVSLYSAVATGTTVIPQDDTIPQITEGNEYMTQTITPKSATNILIIDVEVMIANSANAGKMIALFQDANANALAAKFTYVGNWTDPVNLTLRYSMVAGTTSATTFRVRGGASVAGTTTFNGLLGARLFGAIPKSSIKITEVKA